MKKIRVLLAGETWSSSTTHTKGFDQFSTAEFQSGIGPLLAALEGSDVEIVHLPGHETHTRFPFTAEELKAYDVVVLSDVGANSLLLHPDTFVRGKRTPNRLKAIAEWVEGGGGFMMIGGYFSFQGLNGAARYARTPIETILPVTMLTADDRVEVPEGFHPAPTGAAHPATAGFSGAWPYLLGYNETKLKPEATLLLSVGSDYGDQPLLAAGTYGKGRTMAWTSDIGPHWLPTEFVEWEGYRRLWTQAFAWLAGRS
jgi:uncharacterized membrane protein